MDQRFCIFWIKQCLNTHDYHLPFLLLLHPGLHHQILWRVHCRQVLEKPTPREKEEESTLFSSGEYFSNNMILLLKYTFLTVGAAAAINFFPTAVDPVNVIFLT